MNLSGINKTENLKADIVIIGGGASGLSAAVSAAEAGAKNIIVLEKAKITGGNARMSGGIFAVESPAQKRLGIDITCDKVFKQYMEFSHWKNNPKIVRAFIKKSGDIVQWLEGKGLEFSAVSFGPKWPKVFHLHGQVNEKSLTSNGPKRQNVLGVSGPPIIKALTKSCNNLGVRVLCDTPAKKIIMNINGELEGVLAENKGKELFIAARSVVISTGGFSRNKELLKKYFPSYGDGENIYTQALSQMTGDGLLMATEVGAATNDMVTFTMLGPHHYPWNFHITWLVRRPYLPWVNKNGERYIDEAVRAEAGEAGYSTGCAINRQPHKLSYTLLDTEIKKGIITRIEQFEEARPDWLDDLENDITLEANKGRIKISDSWDEIAEYIGAKPEVLKATIEQYNSFCDKGYDEDFAKDEKYLLPLRTPPYYAVLARQGFATTIGGITINQYMEIINAHDSPISGLYAAGNDTGGWLGDTYGPFPGLAFGFALFSGYTAGERAAKYVLEKEETS